MSLPTPEKTWQISHVSNSLSGVQATDMNDLFLKVKNAAKAFGTAPLTVVGSSDGSTANMSGTDLLTGQPAMVHAGAGSPHSWIVLAHAGIAAGAQVCYDFNDSDARYMSIVVSPTGFAGGSTTARPTAADETVILNDDMWCGRLGTGDGTGGQVRAHVMLSTDGQCFRVLLANDGGVGGFLLVDKPAFPVTGWTNPMISFFRGIGSSTNNRDSDMSANLWGRNEVIKARGPMGAMPMFGTFEGSTNTFTIIADRLALPNEISGEYPLQRVGLWHDDTAGQRGRHGFIFDLWFSLSTLLSGDTFPSDSSKQFVAFGSAVVVGDGTSWAMS